MENGAEATDDIYVNWYKDYIRKFGNHFAKYMLLYIKLFASHKTQSKGKHRFAQRHVQMIKVALS